jgi:hypothetical protein
VTFGVRSSSWSTSITATTDERSQRRTMRANCSSAFINSSLPRSAGPGNASASIRPANASIAATTPVTSGGGVAGAGQSSTSP